MATEGHTWPHMATYGRVWPTHGYTLALQSHTFLDTPTAGTHTYKIQYRAGYAGYSVYIGRSQAGATSPHAGAVPSSLTLMEVAA